MSDPTPSEIKAACARIRARWSVATERARRGVVADQYHFPSGRVVDTPDGPRVDVVE